jgi:uncharacterized protein YbjT (DUF2867 family)
MVSKIFITGGTGNLGKSLSDLLASENIPFTIGSRNNKSGAGNVAIIDLIQNQGLKEALQGKDIIFHLATDLKKETTITQNLLNAIGADPHVHLIYTSVVGTDKVPLAYYKQKLASEQAIKESGLRYTILRATQYHQFINQVISTFLKYPIGILPKKVVSQPIQTEIVASELYLLSLEQPLNKTYHIGGMETLTLEEMANDWLKQTGKKRWVLNLPVCGTLGKTLRDGSLTTPNKQSESISWKQWLTRYYANDAGSAL